MTDYLTSALALVASVNTLLNSLMLWKSFHTTMIAPILKSNGEGKK